jgi:ABC-type uncharacterized transport system permease subunit
LAENVAGRGWIAALVIFASRPAKGLLGALVFGALSIWLPATSHGYQRNQYLVDMIPYIATILIVIST